MKSTGKPLKIDTVFRAFSDPTRVRILNLLRSGELCVCDLVGILDVLQPAASRHLSYLRRAGLVQARKEGQWVFYRLSPAKNCFHERLLECLACSPDQWKQLAVDLKRLQDQGRSDCC